MAHLHATFICVIALLSVSKPPPVQTQTCLAGSPGIPGRHGAPGPAGRDGRDGQEGKTGPRGPAGQAGATGLPGARGLSGVKGNIGAQGLKGDRGEKGSKGETGPVKLTPYTNWREWSWNNLYDGRDDGQIKEVIFQKKFQNSALHVYWNGNLRIFNCDGCCKRWFFKFNGKECCAPGTIDGIVYMWKGKGHKDLHRVRHIEGHCHGTGAQKFPKGQVRVSFWVGNCKHRSSPADAMTGWQSTSRLFIDEVPMPQT